MLFSRKNQKIAFIAALTFLVGCGISFFIWQKNSTIHYLSENKILNFSLLDSQGTAFTLNQQTDSRVVVLIAYRKGCPIVEKNIPTIKTLFDKYKHQEIKFYLMNSNPTDSRTINEEARINLKLPFPVLIDDSQVVADQLGIDRAGEVVVIDPKEMKIFYRGAIDDRLTYGGEKIEARQNYLDNALDSFLRKRTLKVSKTDVLGCAISFPEKKEISYLNDVKPILDKKCLNCHGVSKIPPTSFNNFSEINGWRRMISELVLSRQMPPFEADNHFVEYDNDFSLTAEERWILYKMASLPFVMGEQDNKKNKIEKPGAKKIFNPDIIYETPEFEVPEKPDQNYVYFNIKEDVAEDIWLNGLWIEPRHRASLQHVALFLTSKKIQDGPQMKKMGAMLSLDKNMLGRWGWPPSQMVPSVYQDYAWKLPKGSHLVLELHFNSVGIGQKNSLKIMLQTIPKNKVNRQLIYRLVNCEIDIPAGANPHYSRKIFNIEEPLHLIRYGAHMHWRGSSMKINKIHPNGERQTLISNPQFYFKNRRSYVLKKPMPLPVGRYEIEAAYNNSFTNPLNPDPDKHVTEGGSAEDNEMCSVHLYLLKDIR